jgi:transcriptional regulator with XRE-family HTH domain
VTPLGEVLRAARLRRGLSLRELSALADVDHAYLHRLEVGAKFAPSQAVLSRLHRVLMPGRRSSVSALTLVVCVDSRAWGAS